MIKQSMNQRVATGMAAVAATCMLSSCGNSSLPSSPLTAVREQLQVEAKIIGEKQSGRISRADAPPPALGDANVWQITFTSTNAVIPSPSRGLSWSSAPQQALASVTYSEVGYSSTHFFPTPIHVADDRTFSMNFSFEKAVAAHDISANLVRRSDGVTFVEVSAVASQAASKH